MATNLPSCFPIQCLEQLLKFLVNFTLLKYVKSQRNYGFLITKELIFGFQILDLKDHFSASLIRHCRTIHERSNMLSCAQCDYTTLQKSNLKRHTKRHAKTPLTSNLPPKVARHEPIPNIIEPPANDHLLEQLEHEEIQSMLEQNTQRGFGVTQMS